MSNNNKKSSGSKLGARIACGILAALFVITGAYAIISAIINAAAK